MRKRRTQSIQKGKLGCVTEANTGLAGETLNKDVESWLPLKGKWSNKDNAWENCELKKETRHFCGARSRARALKTEGLRENTDGKGLEDKVNLCSKCLIWRNKELELLS